MRPSSGVGRPLFGYKPAAVYIWTFLGSRFNIYVLCWQICVGRMSVLSWSLLYVWYASFFRDEVCTNDTKRQTQYLFDNLDTMIIYRKHIYRFTIY